MPEPLTPEQHTILRRRMAALNDPEMRLRDWDHGFVADVCFRKPEDLTERQRDMVALLCWRYREQIAALPDHPFPDLIPKREPKLRDKPEKRWADQPTAPIRRQRGLRAPQEGTAR